MKTKQKILAALDCALDDINEDQLIDILLDAYKAKKDRISQLEGENCHERMIMHSERENMHREYQRMRSDPRYFATGEYFFAVNQHKIGVIIQSGKISVYERVKHVDYSGMEMTWPDWERL